MILQKNYLINNYSVNQCFLVYSSHDQLLIAISLYRQVKGDRMAVGNHASLH